MKELFFYGWLGGIWNGEFVEMQFNNNQSIEMKALVYTCAKTKRSPLKIIRAQKRSFIFQPLICNVICRKVIMDGYVFVLFLFYASWKTQIIINT